MLYVGLAVLVVIVGLIITSTFNHWIRSDIDPFMGDLIIRLESASQGSGDVSAAGLKSASAVLEVCRAEIKSVPTFYIPVVFFLFFVFSLSLGIVSLRAHKAVALAVKNRTSDSQTCED